MKKLVLMIATLCFCASALAKGVVEFEYEHERAPGGGLADSVTVAPGVEVGSLKYDLRIDSGLDHTTRQLDYSVEPRIRYTAELKGMKISGRLGIGEHFISGSYNFPYYTLEPQLSLPINDSWAFEISSRYRNAFDTSNSYRTMTTRGGLVYAVTKDDEVGAKLFKKYGDSESSGVLLEYEHGF